MAKKKQSSLTAYQAKRDFDRSPEPLAGKKKARRSGRRPAFVVHRHDARRLHYDLRLEMDGVLKSWAVPKGFSCYPKDKHLAIRTEDHPLEYEHFDGLIPSGQYGAGTMTIWDRGHYELAATDDGLAAIEAGKLEIRFYGARLRGEWHMVKLKDSAQEWLLLKAKDRYARAEGEAALGLDLVGMKKSPFLRRPELMSPRRPRTGLGQLLQPASDWVAELKLPGRRVLALKQNEQIRLRDADGKSVRHVPAAIEESLQKIHAESAVLDGALVCLDQQHLPSAALLEAALAGRNDRPVSLAVWDLLYYEEWDLRPLPWSERKAALGSIVGPLAHVRVVDHERGSAEALLAAAAAAGLPGIVAKRVTSAYVTGRSPDWLEFRAARGGRSAAAAPVEQRRRRTRRKLQFTNLNKTLWPQDGYTKGDLIDYYDRVADALLPHLKDRPLSLTRYPDGIHGESFYQKNAPAHTPDWVPTIELPSDNKQGSIRYILCNDRDTLLYLANLATIELHPWLSRVKHLDSPDFAVLDLDPFGAPLASVVQIASTIGVLLREAGLKPYLKTSGSKGLHIYVALAPGYTYAQSRMFCEVISRLVASRHPDIATLERAKSARVGLVYLDYMQNHRGQTIVAPYAVRPVPAASVSMPLDWEELAADLDPSRFTLRTASQRLEEHGDLFAGVLTDREELSTAIDRLRELVE